MEKGIVQRAFLWLIVLAVLVVGGILGRAFWLASRTIFDLLSENRELKAAISNLTAESQIGFARVLSQTPRGPGSESGTGGRMVTRVLFVETARDDPGKEILRREYEVEGDVVHFDALIVKFGSQLVADGKERALYLWRRVYGEKMTPESGYPIEEAGAEPKRYAELMAKLSLRDRKLFWSEIWKLSNDPDRLKAAGVQAVYGNAVYKPLAPGFRYIFKIGNMGQLYVETVREIGG